MAGFIFHPQYHLEMNISSCFIPNTEQKYLLNISAFLHQSPSGKSREEAVLSAKLEQSRGEARAFHSPTHTGALGGLGAPHTQGSPCTFARANQRGSLLRPCHGQGAGPNPRPLFPTLGASRQPGTRANSSFNPGLRGHHYVNHCVLEAGGQRMGSSLDGGG